MLINTLVTLCCGVASHFFNQHYSQCGCVCYTISGLAFAQTICQVFHGYDTDSTLLLNPKMQFFLQTWFHLRGNKKALQQYNIYYKVAFSQQIINPTQICLLFLLSLVCRFVEHNVKTYEATYRFTYITHTSFSR